MRSRRMNRRGFLGPILVTLVLAIAIPLLADAESGGDTYGALALLAGVGLSEGEEGEWG